MAQLFSSQQLSHNLFCRKWDFHYSSGNIAEELSRDIALLDAISQGECNDTLRFWSTSPAIVVSLAEARLPDYELAQTSLEKRGWQVLTRSTGGTAFPQGPGILNVSAICSIDTARPTINKSYQDFCDLLCLGFKALNLTSSIGAQPHAFCDGNYNILVNGKKLVGTAQRWKRRAQGNAVLAHAAILVDINKSHVSDMVNLFYQLADSDKHFRADALTSINEHGSGIDIAAVQSAISDAFSDAAPTSIE